jgi:hypothetical protein
MTSRNWYCTLLALISITAIVGRVVLAWHGISQEDGIIAIGAAAVGALATLAIASGTRDAAEVDPWVIEEEVDAVLRRRQLPSNVSTDERTITTRDDTGRWPPVTTPKTPPAS